jgi:hypothetical protein
MAYPIPTLQDTIDQNISTFESTIGQNAPSNDKSFINVLSIVQAAIGIGLYKCIADRAKANFAITAIGNDLDIIGQNENTIRKTAVSAEVTATLPATTGTVIPTTIDFVADSNGLRYRATTDATAVAGVATIDLKCAESGSDGSLGIGDTLQIASQITGATTTATVTEVITNGIDQESDENYRPRVLFAQRAITGGANATDHKIWSEAVTGVKAAFCYSGRPPEYGDSFPGDRSVFIESTTDVSTDGIAPQWLLDNVRSAINTDPDTGSARLPLGITDETLYTRSISRTTFYFQIRDFVVDADKDAACKADIITGLTLYCSMIVPFVDGVDVPQERTDTVTSVTVAQIVADVLQSYGARASSTVFGLSNTVFITSYTLGQGELAKFGGVAYA